MADIRLFLPDLDAELDVSQDRQFPLALNYTAGSLRDINNRTTNFSLELRVPANKNNKTALKHLNDTNVLDGSNILKKTSVVVKADGIPIFTGDFKLLGSVNDRGHEEFKCILLGDGMDWAEGMKNKTPRDYDWDNNNSFTINKANVEATWTNTYTDEFTFPLINYGAWSGDGGKTVKAQDLRPALFMRAFFEKAFNAEGYTIQTDTDADDFFSTANNPMADKIVFPFTGNGFSVSSTDLDTYETESTYTSQKRYDWDTSIVHTYNLRKNAGKPIGTINQEVSLGGDGTTDWNSTKKVVRFYLENDESSNFSNYNEDNYAIVRYYDTDLNTTKGEVFEIIRYGIQYLSGIGNVTWVDLLTEIPDSKELSINNTRWSKFGGTLRILSTSIGGASKVDLDTTDTASLVSVANNEFTATDSVSCRFNFECRLGGISQGILNEGIYEFQIIHKSGATETIIGEEIVNATDLDTDPIESVPYYNVGTSNVRNLNYISIGFESGVVNLQNGDKVWVEVVGLPEETSAVFESLYDKDSGASASVSALIKNVVLKSIPSEDITNNYTLTNIKSILDDRFNSLDYIKGCIHAFNLLIDTDPNAKVVKIKTRDNFYDSQTNAVDWTSKIDIKKQYVIDYLDDYNRNLVFKFKDDSADGYLSERNKIATNVAGQYEHELSTRFDEGDTLMENPLFAYTYHMSDKLIISESSTTSSGIWLSRMWKEYGTKPPTVAYDFRPRLLYYTYDYQVLGGGQIWNWEDSTTQSKVPMALPNDFENLTVVPDFGINLGYNDWNDSGFFKTYYEKTVNTIEKSTKVTIPMKLTFKDISTLDITKLIYLDAPADLRGYYILDRVKNFLPSATVTTTVELVKKEDYDAITIDTTQDATDVNWDLYHVEGLKSWDDRGTTKWETGKGVEEQDTADAFSRDQELFVKNDRNVAGLGDITGALKDAREKKSFKERGEQSAVLANSGNFASPNSGSFVAGRGNVSVAKNQSLMGTFAEPSAKVTMAVGAGTSKANTYNAFSVGKDGVVREGAGYVVTEIDGNIEHVWEEVNGELVKIVI